MEVLIKQITKEIDSKRKTFFLDKKGNEYQIEWGQPRFENTGYQLKEDSQFNNKTYSYKGKCKLLAVGEGNTFEVRHIFLDRKTKYRYYINEEEFTLHFESKSNK
ncbi:MAG: hypothetical protein AB8B74_13030 [Crocinitomicaceae bacterium]